MKENKELWELFVLQSHNFEDKAVPMKSYKLNFSLKTFWQTTPDELKFYMSYNCLKEEAILAC